MNKLIIKKYLLFIFLILIIGIISGIIYYYNLDSNIKEGVINTLNDYNIASVNNIFKHLLILIIFLILSFFVVGVPLTIFYLYFEGVSIGFLSTIFTIKYGINGLFYSVIYNLFTKFIFMFLLLIFLKKIIGIAKILVSRLINPNYYTFKTDLILKTKSSLLFLLIIFINDLIIYLTSKSFFILFINLLK